MPRIRLALALAALAGLSALARPGGSQQSGAAPVAGAQSAAPSADGGARAVPPIELAEIHERLGKLSADARRWGGRAGAIVVDVSSGATLAALDEHGLYNPASNAKIFTAAAALRVLGPGHRFLTGLYGARSGSTVRELVIRGMGDPSLMTSDLWDMARDLRAAGVRSVGSIAVDQGYFDDRYVPPAFEQQPSEWAAFRAPVAAASLNENTVTFIVRAAASGHAAAVNMDPPGFVELSGKVATVDRGAPERILLDLEPRGARLHGRLGGSLPEGSRLVRFAKRVDDPRLFVGHALREILQAGGVRVTGELKLGGEREKRLLVAHRSAPLTQLLHLLGKKSDNFYAETLFKTMAAEERGRPGTAAAAAEVVIATVEALGANERGLVVKNGSGLFDANRASPSSIAHLLRAVLRDPSLGPDFTAQLAIGGVDGTLRGRFRSWAKRRVIRAKTGTLNSVACLSGYVLPPPGRSPIAFSILVNGISGKVSATRRDIDRVVDAIARALWRDGR